MPFRRSSIGAGDLAAIGVGVHMAAAIGAGAPEAVVTGVGVPEAGTAAIGVGAPEAGAAAGNIAWRKPVLDGVRLIGVVKMAAPTATVNALQERDRIEIL